MMNPSAAMGDGAVGGPAMGEVVAGEPRVLADGVQGKGVRGLAGGHGYEAPRLRRLGVLRSVAGSDPNSTGNPIGSLPAGWGA